MFKHSLRWADLRGANLTGSSLSKADLTGADLTGAILRDVYLENVNFTGADLTDAVLFFVDLRGADLSGADLSGADLTGADLTGVKLCNTKLPNDVFRIEGLSRDFFVIHGFIRINYQYHTIETWDAFSDEEIAKMDSDTSAFWLENKHKIMAAIKTAKPEVRKATYRSA